MKFGQLSQIGGRFFFTASNNTGNGYQSANCTPCISTGLLYLKIHLAFTIKNTKSA